ncbi:unnamed protein product, partial [Brenthis ino]
MDQKELSFLLLVIMLVSNMEAVKNNKLNVEASLKQVDMMFPPEMKDATKASIEKCKDVSKKFKDLCEASYWTAKCIYEDNPKNFLFA